MCGICGYVRKELISRDILIEMNDTMIHRGPNDWGVWEKQTDSYAVGLAQRRLSILDLSELGHQPMTSADGLATISYNGEIYNFRELREELEEKGHRFKSTCDTEVILSAYREWGCECFKRFNGMFAIALYDEENDQLVLARDRIGKKPLYYYFNGTEFAFGSELKPIMKYPPFEKKINYDIIGHFMCNKYIVAPMTIFENTYKLEPGSFLVLKNWEIKVSRYWDLVAIHNAATQDIKNLADAKAQLNDLLTDAIEKRLVADVPVGTFLSGGIDSTLITAIANRLTDKPIDSFSIGFFDEKRNEAPFSAAIAKHIGTNHHELYMDDQQILDMLIELPKYFDEPFSDNSQLPTMLVSKMAKEKVTVALAGDGGDELFCGYAKYDLIWIAQHVDFLGAIESKMPWNKLLLSKSPDKISAFVNNRQKATKAQLFVDVMIMEAEKILKPHVVNVKFKAEERIQSPNLQDKLMVLDMMTYMPDEILHKTDNAAMKYSLEVRCPLTDYRIIEWSFRVAHSLKYHNFTKKYLLKELTYDYVPKKLLDRPKNGFGAPIGTWMKTVLKPEIEKYADPVKLEKQGIFDAVGVRNLIETQNRTNNSKYNNLLWSFYIFQSWYDEYIERF